MMCVLVIDNVTNCHHVHFGCVVLARFDTDEYNASLQAAAKQVELYSAHVSSCVACVV